MTLGRIVGTVVCSRSAAEIPGAVWRLAETCDHNGEGSDDVMIVLDLVGAEKGDVVLLCRGSSVRWTDRTADKPVDAVIVGLVDIIDEGGIVTYRR
ncbi:MAG: EutN/CcmL family microcompartment protein [Spirochaetaceae bacterium]|nr:EutN/CcmL family microcompartment protein [Spirochaetaceae bacterium]